MKRSIYIVRGALAIVFAGMLALQISTAQTAPHSEADMAVSYKKTSAKGFDDLVASVEKAAASKKFKVLQKHNISASLAEKGFELPPYIIIEVCNASYAHKVLTNNKEAGMMLPCRIAVYEDEGVNTVIMMKPSLIGTFIPGDYGSVPEDVEKTLIEVINEAVL